MPTTTRREHLRRGAYRKLGRQYAGWIVFFDLWWLWLGLLSLALLARVAYLAWTEVDPVTLAWLTGVAAVGVGGGYLVFGARARRYRFGPARVLVPSLVGVAVVALTVASWASVTVPR